MRADLTVFENGSPEPQPPPSWHSAPAESASPPAGTSFPRSLRRRWPLVVVAALLGCAGGVGLGRVASPTYSSSTSVFLEPVAGNPLDGTSPSNAQQLVVAMQTEASLVTAPDVLARASKMIGHRLAPGTTQVTASVPTNTQIVQIQFTGSSPARAEAGAAAVAKAFLEHRSHEGTATLQRQLATLENQRRAAQAQLSDALHQASGPKPAGGTSSRVQLATSRVANLDQSIGTLQAEAVDPGSVVAPASTPVAGLLEQPRVILAGTGLAGLLLGLIVVWLWGRRDDRLHRRQIGGVPVWGRVYAARHAPVPVEDLPLDHPAREDLRQVRTSVVRAHQRPCVVTVTAAPEVRFARETAADLAVVLRAAGHQVAFVDASFEPAPEGVTESVTPQDLAALLRPHRPTRPGRSVVLGRWRRVGWLPGGDGLADVRDLLCGDRMTDMLDRLRSQYDYVVVAAPRVSSAEAMALGAGADLTLLVVHSGVPDTQVETAVATHAEAGSEIRGLIGVTRERRFRGVRPKEVG